MILKKILIDTLTNPKTNKFSRKSVTMFLSFINLLFLTWTDVITSMPFLQKCCKVNVSEFLIIVFACLSFGQSVLTVVDKYKK